jgi:hypothetical protein
MIPKSQIIIFYVASNGEIISEKVELIFEEKFKNQVKIKIIFLKLVYPF